MNSHNRDQRPQLLYEIFPLIANNDRKIPLLITTSVKILQLKVGELIKLYDCAGAQKYILLSELVRKC